MPEEEYSIWDFRRYHFEYYEITMNDCSLCNEGSDLYIIEEDNGGVYAIHREHLEKKDSV